MEGSLTSTKALEAKVDALRALLDPETIAAWLDEVESYRQHPAKSVSAQSVVVHREPALPEPLLTAQQVRERLGVSKGVIYRMVKADEIPHIKIGNRIRFVWSRVQEWLDDWPQNGVS